MRKHKRICLVGAVLWSLLASCSPTETAVHPSDTGPKKSSEIVELDVGMLGTSIKPVGVLVADALGYFEEEGIGVHFQTVSSMNDAYVAVSAGDLDVYLFSSTAAATVKITPSTVSRNTVNDSTASTTARARSPPTI